MGRSKLLRRPGRGLHSLRRRLRQRWWLRKHVICGTWPGPVHAGDHLQVCWMRWRLRCSPPEEGFHMPHHDVLLAELAPVAAAVALALVGDFLLPALRLLAGSICPCSSNGVVASAAAVLLPDKRNRLPHSGTSNSAAHSAADTAANASACRSSRPLQLRSGHTGQVAGRQEVVVLQDPWKGLPSAASPAANANANANAHRASRASSSCRPLQLR